ncbi:MAG: glycoside hydrolase family 5 protein [Clostridiales bacterium]|nr:glycoside hydrolase family 5 protein [Clostridiales bacterium]
MEFYNFCFKNAYYASRRLENKSSTNNWGIGFAYCYKVTDAHDENITVESEVGSDTTSSISTPIVHEMDVLEKHKKGENIMAKVSVKEQRFIDEKGRHMILRGINLVYKGEKTGDKMDYIASWDEELFRKFKEWGFNVVRLGIIWDAVEPKPGKFDDEYLDWIEKMLDFCEKYDIYAYLDSHQDLYSVLYSDGAPEWATITDNKPHVDGELWSDAYIFSEAVKRAFDNFWNNTQTSNGIGIQDHYVNMWVHVVRRFANHPAVIGYDFLNEPFPGSAATEIFGTLMGTLAETMNKALGTSHSLEDMIGLFSDQKGKLQVLDLIEDKTVHASVAKVVEPLVEKFDKGDLANFYGKVSRAVREIDKKSIIMRENSYFSNIGIECKAEPILDKKGNKDPNQAYSPHGYDLVVDTEAVQYASNNRVEVIFEAHRRTQQNMDVPVMVGEWGAHASYSQGLSHIDHLLNIFDSYLWSSTYWCYFDEFSKAPVLDTLRRPYPQAVCGEIKSFEYDSSSKEFTMTWDEGEKELPTTIYLPQAKFSIEPSVKYSIESIGESVIVTLEAIGGERNITIKL